MPIKKKYGDSLSWGDLIIYAADVMMENAGLPVIGTCFGRVDETSGYWSIELGPNQAQELVTPCLAGSVKGSEIDCDGNCDGNCLAPFGASTTQLIYVHPGGVKTEEHPDANNPYDLQLMADNIRDVFSRMGMNDSELVAISGGGHAFGKVHGACPLGAGKSPFEAEVKGEKPWQGLCGESEMQGKAENTFTSGFEGPWSERPYEWSNLYYQYLAYDEFEMVNSPASDTTDPDPANWRNITQWWMKDPARRYATMAPAAHGTGKVPIQMLTSDFSLTVDPSYKKIVKTFADDIKELEHAFTHAWYKLTTRDMGPRSRCLGPLVPPEQDWQQPLYNPTTAMQDEISHLYRHLKEFVRGAEVEYISLAANSAATHRVTDYLGGANGARIQYSPEKDWPQNVGLQPALSKLKNLKLDYHVSLADRIVLAGMVALEAKGITGLSFCPGRGDAKDGSASVDLELNLLKDFKFAESEGPLAKHAMKISGLTVIEAVAFLFHKTPNKAAVIALVELFEVDGDLESTASVAQRFAFYNAETLEALYELCEDDNFDIHFRAAWTKKMNADRYDGPTKNVCEKLCVCAEEETDDPSQRELMFASHDLGSHDHPPLEPALLPHASCVC